MFLVPGNVVSLALRVLLKAHGRLRVLLVTESWWTQLQRALAFVTSWGEISDALTQCDIH